MSKNYLLSQFQNIDKKIVYIILIIFSTKSFQFCHITVIFKILFIDKFNIKYFTCQSKSSLSNAFNKVKKIV